MSLRKTFVMTMVLFMAACAGHKPPAPVVQKTLKKTFINPISKPLKAIKNPIKSRALLNKNGMWVRSKLGAPAFIHADRMAKIWLYENKDCRLNLFLYADDKASTVFRVLHFDARDKQGHNTDRDQCLATF